MPSYSVLIEKDSYPNNINFTDLAENEYISSLEIVSSSADAGKYTVLGPSYGTIELYIAGHSMISQSALHTFRKSKSSTTTQTPKLLSARTFTKQQQLASIGAPNVRLLFLYYSWVDEKPTSVISFDCVLHTKYEPIFSISNTDHGVVTSSISQGCVFPDTEIQLTPIPENGYVLNGWISSPQITITNNSFVMPDYDVTITPIFVPKNAGYYNGDYYDPCVPMYYDGSNWIECEWKYYDGTNWLDADAT